jgi:hypothetical protein
MSFDFLTFIVIVNVAFTIALWSQAARRPEKLKKKFVKRLHSGDPITPKHQPPQTLGGDFASQVSREDRLFFNDFAEFGVVNKWLADEHVGSRWRLQELPETELTLHGVFDYGPSFGRRYEVFYNQVHVGELEIQPFMYDKADGQSVITRIHLDYVRLLTFGTIRDFFAAIAMHACYESRDSKEYLEAQQAMDRAMTEALWRSNAVDVYDINAADYGEIDLRLDGVASFYLERRAARTSPGGAQHRTNSCCRQRWRNRSALLPRFAPYVGPLLLNRPERSRGRFRRFA